MLTLEIVLTLILAIYIAFSTKKWKHATPVQKFFTVLASLLAIVIAINAIQKERKADFIDKVYATIGDLNDLDGAEIPKIRLGNSLSFFTTNTYESLTLPISNGSFQIYLKNKRIVVNAILRDIDGKIIGAVLNNEWRMFDTENFDYNNDDTGFEVISKFDRKVYYQADYKNGAVNLFGLFVNENGFGGYVFGDEGKNGETIFMKGVKFKNINIPYVPHLFLYPRDVHPGERIKS
ncbi:hypothetical protein JN11_04904 [Mucilaginibacter frigoritolerans]|uniref:WG repeat protein n=1 Tax=Mucilaginibacter frigoritolerans TaxID=652788 RepID=A0A562TK59_9SPHI|nr:hypothetical protein [Mucilaginibacter frigoritolerans]TWI93939.1 hypothetical protein JN11_04904 [Mucilaginibacter frigoritolerans]